MSVAKKILSPSSDGGGDDPDDESTLEGGPFFDMRGDTVLWWNNLEKDKRYVHWSSSLKEVRIFVPFNI